MPRLFRAEDSSAAIAPAPAGIVARQPDGASLYVTDEVFLYRVVATAASAIGEMVEFEDCYSLDVVLVPMRALRARRLRVVTPAPGDC